MTGERVGERVVERDWAQPWKRRGDCVVCGVVGHLVAMCERCSKWSCEREGCVKVVKELRMCAVPAVRL